MSQIIATGRSVAPARWPRSRLITLPTVLSLALAADLIVQTVRAGVNFKF
jgi:hypothetical protein